MPRRWLTIRMVKTAHDEAIALSGGEPGVRSEQVLRDVMRAPRLAYARTPNTFRPAAAYCGGILARRPFRDGNRRTGNLSAHLFLALNGWRLLPEEAELAAVMGLFADGTLDEEMLTYWLEDCARLRAREHGFAERARGRPAPELRWRLPSWREPEVVRADIEKLKRGGPKYHNDPVNYYAEMEALEEELSRAEKDRADKAPSPRLSREQLRARKR